MRMARPIFSRLHNNLGYDQLKCLRCGGAVGHAVVDSAEDCGSNPGAVTCLSQLNDTLQLIAFLSRKLNDE